VSDVTGNVMRWAALTETARALQEASLRDQLTALYNRRFMWEWLAHELKQARRHGYPLGCLLLDIDHFKKINDTLGHEAGDRVLTGFAALLNKQMRESDVLVRYGGEEFVVLLPHCNLQHGVSKARTIVQAVRATSIGALETGRITCSIGVAACNPAQPQSGEELIKQADLRLYEAKESGRDRVCPA
jgi:diguanylate cyclase (GGDEF)-like protein